MINLNINLYLDENYFYLFCLYTHCKMRCHYVEKRI